MFRLTSPAPINANNLFWTEKEAKAKCEELKARRDNLGTNLANVSAPQLLEAEECRRLLEEHPGISLRDAVQGFLEIHQTRVPPFLSASCFKISLIVSQEKPALPEPLALAQKQLAGLNDILASDLTVRKLDETLQSFRPTVRNAFQRYLRLHSIGNQTQLSAKQPGSETRFRGSR